MKVSILTNCMHFVPVDKIVCKVTHNDPHPVPTKTLHNDPHPVPNDPHPVPTFCELQGSVLGTIYPVPTRLMYFMSFEALLCGSKSLLIKLDHSASANRNLPKSKFNYVHPLQLPREAGFYRRHLWWCSHGSCDRCPSMC